MSNEPCGGTWDNDIFLRLNDGNAPVALIAGRSAKFPDLESFAAYLNTFVGTLEDGWFVFSYGGDVGRSLSLRLVSQALPRADGTPIDLRPKMLFDCPYVKSEYKSGIVDIQYDGDELKLNFNEPSTAE